MTRDQALDELVALARHLRANPDRIRDNLKKLENIQRMLNYHTIPQKAAEWKVDSVGEIHCSADGCGVDWRHYDACLLNFAPVGRPPVFYCREHHPPPKQKHAGKPVGWTEPLDKEVAGK